MKKLDYYIQKKRFIAAKKYILPHSEILDIGCSKGELFDFLKDLKICGIGMDPDVANEGEKSKDIFLFKSSFPNEQLLEKKFDYITALAVMEHIPLEDLNNFVKSCYSILRTGGKLIITVPSTIVDYILIVLKAFHLVDTMHLDQHHGVKPNQIKEAILKQPFNLIEHEKFELGLNNIFVFEKTSH